MAQKNLLGKIIEKTAESLLTVSGALTTIAILFITIFLFKEGFGLFKTPAIEDGYGLYVNPENPVNQLHPLDVKNMYDEEIINWKEVGGTDWEIMVFRIDDVFDYYSDEDLGENYSLLPEKLGHIISDHKNIIAYVPEEFAPSAAQGAKEVKVLNTTVSDFFLGKEWLPTATPSPLFGSLPLILGTLLVSLIAIVLALPLGLGVAVYLSELADERMRKFLKPVIELLAGIPSVVYGFFGLVVVAPLVQKAFNLPVGETAFTGGLILAIMALPTIISVAEDAIRNTPTAMREASLALGATQWQTIRKVVIPYAGSGISAAAVLGIGRAVGETMAVLMITGNAAVIPTSIFEPVRTIPATIAAELGEAPSGGQHYQALFLLGCILFLISMMISVVSEMVSKKKNYKSV